MNSILDRYIDGKFEYETSSLDFSCSKIEQNMNRDTVFEGEFTIQCSDDKRAEGYILTTNNRLKCKRKTFTGSKIVIPYSFHSLGMDEGEVLRAEFNIISNMGEYYIPFIAIIEHQNLQSSLGAIKNLFHFANLAKTNWEESVKLFYKKEFAQILNGVDRQYYSIYQGLSGVYGNEQNVDEFLIKINKKTRTEYIPMESCIRLDAPYGISEGKATITRNGWGYTNLRVLTDGDFLSVEKEVLTDDDFLGNICSFSYHIDSSKLHAGNNYGSITVLSTSVSVVIEFQVIGEQMKSLKLGNKRRMQELTLELVRLYCSFRLKKRNAASWLKESSKVVEQMNDLNDDNIMSRLFKTQILITEERYNEAKWQLGMIEKEISKENTAPDIWCYYLYLTTLSNREESYVDQIADEVDHIYMQNSGNWKIAWLLLYLKEEYATSPYRRFAFLEQQYIENCKSPVIYLEAVLLMNANPSLLNKLTDFEIQVLNYAAKNDVLGHDVIVQLQYLMTKVKEYSLRLYRILTTCYHKYPEEETLQCIIALLMKKNRVDREAFDWYQLAVDKELKITRLYEYYMMSLPAGYDKPLPKMVMMYFAYHSELDYIRKALLYASILKHQEEFPEIAQTYREAIDIFLVEQIRKGHINRELAYLYKNAMTPLALKPEFIEDLIPLLFTNMIRVENKQIHSVILIYDKVKGERSYPLTQEGTAFIPIYLSEYQILLQDNIGNRYCTDIEYAIEKLMIPGKYAKEIEASSTTPLGFDLYQCENTRNNISITSKNCDSYHHLYESDRVACEYRNEIGLKLMQYYFDNDRIIEGEKLLDTVEPEKLHAKERGVYIQAFVNRGMLDKAFNWISEYGIDQVDTATLVKLCSKMLVRTEFEKDDTMLLLVFQTFQTGKYDENIMKYLVEYYDGMTKDMRDIWKTANDFGIDTQGIRERMILQILFCGSFVGQKNEIFEQYTANGGRLLVEMAYLTHSAYEYLVKDKIQEEFIFRHLTKLFYRGENFHVVCKYAYIKYYSENKEKIDEGVLQLVNRFIAESIQEHVYFPFYLSYKGIVPEVQKLMDKTMIEYHANPKAKVSIHYILQKDNEDAGSYQAERMVNMYEGIYVKSFTLFFGEKLQYYITEDTDGIEQLTESDKINQSEVTQDEDGSKFYLINDMMVAKTLQEYRTVDQLLEDYMKKDYLVNDLFSLL